MSELTRTFCKSMVLRLSGKPFAPTTKEAVGELIDTLLACCQSENHAKLTIDECVIQENCPDPAGIRTAAFNTRETEMLPRTDCPTCGGIGFRSVQRSGKDGAPVYFSEKCLCWIAQRRAS
jgi:hypothetical protein